MTKQKNTVTKTRSPRSQKYGHDLRPATKGQEEYIATMCENTVTIGIGPAGTGKSYCSIGLACQKLLEGEYQRIVITRPCVEAAPRSLGALPGDIDEKVGPYLIPAVEHMKHFLGPDVYRDLRAKELIVIEPLEFMRGRTFENAFIIGEEFQNATTEQIKMFITRLGKNSKIVIDGDIEQTDLKKTNSAYKSDLEYVIVKIENANLKQFAIHELTEADIQRNPIIGPFLRAFR